MTPFAINMMLALVWAALFGDFGIVTLTVGFVVAYCVIWLMQPIFGHDRYCSRLFEIVVLILYFHWELLISSIKVAWDVITPRHLSTPGVIAVPIDARTDTEITLLGNLVTLTPGTLTLDVSDDCKTMLVHAMYVDDADSLRAEIKRGMEKRVLEATR